MGKGSDRLSATGIKSSKLKAGHHADGRGLYLIVRKSGTKSWSYLWIRKGRRREMGLGGYPDTSLEQARKKAQTIRTQIAAGLDPFHERDKGAPKTFGEIADMVLAEKERQWAKPKDGSNWRRALNVHCKPIRKIMIDAIQTTDVVRVLKPVMERTPETGRQLRYRIEFVIDYATTLGMREGDNPARWRGHLKHLFGNTTREVKRHFPSMPYDALPSFISKIREKNSIPALALESPKCH